LTVVVSVYYEGVQKTEASYSSVKPTFLGILMTILMQTLVEIVDIGVNREPLLKGKDQYTSPPCSNYLDQLLWIVKLYHYFLHNKLS
jgi:hypothetical protein